MNQNIQTYLKENRESHLQELFNLLSIPSISALPDHKEDVSRAANWVAESLQKIGMDNVSIHPTKGHPVVYGDWLHAEGKPTVLIYGHYDVQPVDPLHLWDSPPFEPEIRDEKLFARGASDDKGQTFMHIKALEAILKTEGSLPLNFKFCIEGEEEVGSPNLPAFVEENKELLAADVIVISDTSMMERGKPTICYGVRGLAGLQIDIKGSKSDLHSGLYGGGVHNPINALVQLLDSFHSEDGAVTVEGFYDDVLPLTDEEKQAYQDLQFDEEKQREELGVPALYGEKGYSYLERTWVRPTLDINGIYGGFQGDGIKTVIPSEAHAKITCRLVPNQDPEVIIEQLTRHIEKNKPAGVDVNITLFDKGAPYVTPFDHPAIQAAGRAYEAIYEVPTSYTRGGGSLPIISTLDQVLHAPIVLMGFGLPTENFHAPNEHFHLENFDKGMETLCTYWFELEKSL
ncbi:dipeptidase [Fredinandcohnia sp. 179-A 10B2 NHS]|uniref:dipeptidase n=1 Tax=Fredinandcohnia sp. 179-A 10B2 NHS TaxID=3235176 RepID=UPI0039A189DF